MERTESVMDDRMDRQRHSYKHLSTSELCIMKVKFVLKAVRQILSTLDLDILLHSYISDLKPVL